jgi:hypothetical protein
VNQIPSEGKSFSFFLFSFLVGCYMRMVEEDEK